MEEINIKILKFMFEGKTKSAELLKFYKNYGFETERAFHSLNIYYEKNKKENSENIKAYKTFESLLKYIEKNNIKLINISQDIYPTLLREIDNPPIMIFIRGNLEKLSNFSIAVVGSRKCTSYGKDAANYISRNLSEKGITVVSGLAIGIDSYAHSSAVTAEGGSIAVLGSGIDIIYPPENRLLFNKIIENGIIVSEFIPGTPPLKSNFPIRNRIISGLSRGVVLIEAPEKSGAMITCYLALKQDREIFAIPGNIFNSNCRGNHILIKQGAKLIENIEDILEEYGYYLNKKSDFPTIAGKEKINGNEKNFIKLSKNQKKVLSVIGYKQKSIEAIAYETGLQIPELMAILSWLELKGFIKEFSFGSYCMIF